ncbi:MAG: hypothetical protein LBU67_03720 [Oscillospiraceae bacterium]|jgi:hypothetical protein|nr:hypothetical protein [Oscillospiraceae bacterium]
MGARVQLYAFTEVRILIRAYDGALIEERDVAVEPAGTDVPRYALRAMIAYCEEKGIKPVDMTDEERRLFIVEPDETKANIV